jgi:hypothetical protein
LGFLAPPSLAPASNRRSEQEADMARRDFAHGQSQEHESAEARLHDARETRAVMQGRREDARNSGQGELEASVALHAAEEQMAAREAWMEWLGRDY